MKFRTPRSGHTPLILAARSAPPGIVLQLLEAGAEPDTEDEDGQTPLEYATRASNLESMEHLLKYKANISDESLHIAARQLDNSAALLLLGHGASTTLPGTFHCDNRIPLGELCCMADLQQNPPQLKTTLKTLYKATSDFKILTNGKSLILHALDNKSSLKMTKALLTSCPDIQKSLNEDFNIYAAKSFRYGPTAYVRQFRCMEPSAPNALDFFYRCCNHDACPAPALETLLRVHGCEDRFWDDSGGANQPQGFRDPPLAILNALKDAEGRSRELARQARVKLEEKTRREAADAAERDHLDKIQANKNREAAEDRRRERERLRVLEEGKAAEIRAARELADAERARVRVLEEENAAELRAVRDLADAEIQRKQRLAAVEAEADRARTRREQNEFNAKLERERAEFNDHQRRKKASEERKLKHQQRQAREDERTLSERANIKAAQRERETKAQRSLLDKTKEVVRARTDTFDSAAGMMRQVEFSGTGQAPIGRILKELED